MIRSDDVSFHTPSQLLVCHPCHSAILPGPNSLLKHCQKKHCGTPRSVIETIINRQTSDPTSSGPDESAWYTCESLHKTAYHPLVPIPSIEVVKGLKCSSCPRVFPGRRQLRRHCVAVHNGRQDDHPVEHVLVQAAFNTLQNRFHCPVRLPCDMSSGKTNELTDLLDVRPSAVSFNEREVCDFVEIVNPVARLDFVGLDRPFAYTLGNGTFGEKCPFILSLIPNIRNCVSAFFTQAGKVAQSRGFAVSEAVRMAVASPGVREKNKCFKFYSDDTFDKYVNSTVRIVLFILRVFVLQTNNRNEILGRIVLDGDMQSACAAFVHTLRAHAKPCATHPSCYWEDSNSFNLTVSSLVCANCKLVCSSRIAANSNESLPDHRVSSDCLDGLSRSSTCSALCADPKTITDSHKTGVSSGLITGELAPRNESEEHLQESIHALFRMLKKFFFQPVDINVDSAPTIAQTFLTTILVAKRGADVGFCEGRAISDVLAGALYASSVTAIMSIYVWPSGGDSNTELLSVRRQMEPSQGLGVHEFVALLAKTKISRGKEKFVPSWNPCNQNGHKFCGHVHGHHISMRDIGMTIQRMQEAFVKLMFGPSGVFPKGFGNDEFLGMVKKMKDDPHSKDVGYSFTTHHENLQVKNMTNVMLKMFLTTVHEMDETKKHMAMHRILEKMDQLAILLTGMLHLSSGMCGRGSELESLPISNSAGNPFRSFFFLDGQLTILPFHTKTRNATTNKINGDCRTVTRHPDAISSELFKLFVLLVIPVRSVFRRKIQIAEHGSLPTNEKQLEELHATRFIISNEKTRKNIASRLGSCWRKYGLTIPVQYFRQWSAGVSKLLSASNKDMAFTLKYLKPADSSNENMEMDDVVQDTLTFQGSHSKTVDRVHYAREISEMLKDQTTSSHDILRFMAASRAWIDALELKKTPVRDILTVVFQQKDKTKGKPLEDDVHGKGSLVGGHPCPDLKTVCYSNMGSDDDNDEQVQPCGDLKTVVNPHKPSMEDELHGKGSLVGRHPCSDHKTVCNPNMGSENDNGGQVQPCADFKTVVNPHIGSGTETYQQTYSCSEPKTVQDRNKGSNPQNIRQVNSCAGSRTVDNLNTVSPNADNHSGDNNVDTFVTPVKQTRPNRWDHQDTSEGGSIPATTVAVSSSTAYNRKRKATTHVESMQAGAKRLVFDTGATDRAILALKLGLGLGNGTVPRFRSIVQERAMRAVQARKNDLLIVDRTGGGKSATIFGPCHLEHGVTILLVPLRSLRNDMERRCRDINLPAFCFSQLGNDISFEEIERGVVICSPEECTPEKTVNVVKTLVSLGKLNRIVIDEVHLIWLSEEFRYCMTSLYFLRPLDLPTPVKIPLVMMSATVPTHLESQMINATGANPFSTTVIRGDLRRSNVQIRVEKVDNGTSTTVLIQRTCESVFANMTNPQFGHGRHIISVLSRTEVHHVSDLMTCFVEETPIISGKICILMYHSGLKPEVKTSALEEWNSPRGEGDNILMICTSAFGTGIDAPDVRSVTVMGAIRSLIELTQVMGRIGRDGSRGLCHIVYCTNQLDRCGVEDDDAKGLLVDFQRWAEKPNMCRHLLLDQYNGSSGEALSCIEANHHPSTRCDICQNRNTTPPASIQKANRTQIQVPVTRNSNGYVESPGTSMGTHQSHMGMPVNRTVRLARLHPIQEIDCTEELRRMAKEIDNHCIPCVLKNGKASSKTFTKVPRHPHGRHCMKNRCLKCSGPGHDAAMCSTVRGAWKAKCFVCGLRSFNGTFLHRGRGTGQNEYGSVPNCPFKNVMRLSLAALQDERMRHAVLQNNDIPKDYDPEQYASWLCTDKSSCRPGIFVLTPILFTMLKFDEVSQ